MPTNERLSVRLGSLKAPLDARAAAEGISPGELARIAIAAYLGVDKPEIKMGFAAVDPKQMDRLRKKALKVRRSNSKAKRTASE
jgi:hypothetical protein